MNLSTVLGSSTSGLAGNGTSSSQATAATNSTSPLLAKAGQRIQSDVDATKAQLSQLGLLKSALADGQVAAKALSGLGASSSATEVTTALGGLFKTFNSAVRAAITASSAAGPAVVSSNARRVVQDLKSALRADPATAAALKKLGLSVLSAAGGVRAALALVGNKVDTVNSAELGSKGTVATALTHLNQHSAVLTTQQTALKTLQQAMAAYQTNS
jgi:hypothetical protein